MISFNLPNVITITIMAALGYALLTIFAQVFMRQGGVASQATY